MTLQNYRQKLKCATNYKEKARKNIKLHKIDRFERRNDFVNSFVGEDVLRDCNEWLKKDSKCL